MKQNTQNQFNPEAEAVLTYVPDFQTTPLTITGIGESLLPIVEAVERDYTAQVDKVSASAIKAVQTAPEMPTQLTGLRASIAAKLFDLTERTDLYSELQRQRKEERVLAMARKVGVLPTVYCAKHERELAKVRGL